MEVMTDPLGAGSLLLAAEHVHRALSRAEIEQNRPEI